jgi:hypothetical protein
MKEHVLWIVHLMEDAKMEFVNVLKGGVEIIVKYNYIIKYFLKKYLSNKYLSFKRFCNAQTVAVIMVFAKE